jgi:hypothetical protein
MNVEKAIVNSDVWTARSKWEEYRALVKAGTATDAEDLARKAFRAMWFGKQVLDLNLVIPQHGVFDSGLPKLAIARAHWPFVFAWWSEGRVSFTRESRRWSTRGAKQQMTHNPRVLMPGEMRPRDQGSTHGRAQVPSVPPKLRPEGALSGYHVLFEAKWERVPPVDPLLLSHLGGPFYVVRAHWDLTPLEQGLLRALL